MLILTRRVGETLMIGDAVTVTVLGVKGNQVRIGVNAPKVRHKISNGCHLFGLIYSTTKRHWCQEGRICFEY